jgi:hypothetical protein
MDNDSIRKIKRMVDSSNINRRREIGDYEYGVG